MVLQTHNTLPENAEPFSERELVESARVAYLAGKFEEMDALFTRALKKCPAAHWIHNEFAIHLRKVGRLSDAIEHYSKALVLAPGSVDILLNLSLALREAGDLAGAIQTLHTGLQIDPDNARAWNQLGNCHRDANDLQSAQACFRRALTIHPEHLIATNNLANLLQDIGDYHEAARLFQKAVQIDASNSLIWINYGNCLALMGCPQQSIGAYKRAVQAAPTSSNAHFALNKALLELGDRGEFLNSLTYYPGWMRDKEMLSRVGRLMSMIGDYGRAFELLTAATAAEPCAAQDWLDLADVAINLGKVDVAHRAANRSINVDRADVPVLIASAQILKRTGHSTEALSLLARIPDAEKWRPSYVALDRSIQQDSGIGFEINDLDDIHICRVKAPRGYESIELLNDELRGLLTALHAVSSRPVGQSVYSGTQTVGSLWSRQEKPLVALKGVVASAVSDYLTERRIATSHPYWRPRLSSFAFADAWSICVGQGGGHVDHIHPDGWISGVYYVSSPSDLWHSAVNGGWLQFANDAIPCTSEPILSVPPHPGKLVLFPSYLRHSVNKQKIEGARIVVSFDLIPSSDPVDQSARRLPH